jgi:hypothetical protein
MHFKRKKPRIRWANEDGCPYCDKTIRRGSAPLQMPRSDRKRFQSAAAQLRNDTTGSKPSFRYQHKSLTGIIIE